MRIAPPNIEKNLFLERIRSGQKPKYIPDNLKNDRETILTTVSLDGKQLIYASVELKNDREIVLAAVSKNGIALKYASNELKNDRDIVLAAVSKNEQALKYASNELKNNREIVLKAITQNGRESETSSIVPYSNEESLALFDKNGGALQYASLEFRNNRDIVLAAVNQNGLALKHESNKLNNDREIVLTAVNQNGIALEYTSNELKNDIKIVLAAVCQNGEALDHASETLQGDSEKEGSLKNYLLKTVKEYNTSYDTFNTFLTAQTVPASNKAAEDNNDQKPNNKLPLLNKLGKYGKLSINPEIAKYAGVQIKFNNDWPVIKKACMNLGMENFLDLRKNPPVKIAVSGANKLSNQNDKNQSEGIV